MRRRIGQLVAIVVVAVGALALSAGCSSSQVCSNVLVTRQPSPVFSNYGLGSPRGGVALPAPSTPSNRLSEQDDRDAWDAVAGHARTTSGGQLVLTKPHVGYVLTSASGAQLASYQMGAGQYTGPIELIFSVPSNDDRLATRSVRGTARAMGGVHAVFDLATHRLVQFTPVGMDAFIADDPQDFTELGSIERSCYKTTD